MLDTPLKTAFTSRAPAMSTMSVRMGVPMGSSYTPGLSTSPITENTMVPGVSTVPTSRNQSAPLARM